MNVHVVNKYDKIRVMCDNYIGYIQQITFMTLRKFKNEVCMFFTTSCYRFCLSHAECDRWKPRRQHQRDLAFTAWSVPPLVLLTEYKIDDKSTTIAEKKKISNLKYQH